MKKKKQAAVAALITGFLASGSLGATAPAAVALSPRGEMEGYRDYVLGRYAWSNDELATAARYFSRALQHQEGDPVLRQRAFELALASGNRRLALEMARDVLAADPENSTAALVLIAESFRKGDYRNARPLISKLAVGGIEAVVAPILTAWAQQGQGDRKAAADTIQPPDTEGVVRLYHLEHAGHIALVQGRAEEALDFYRQILQMDGNGLWRLRLPAAVAAQRAGNDAQARALLEMEIDPDRQAYFAEARRRLAEGKKIELPVANPAQGLAELMIHAATDLMQGEPIPLALVFARVAEIARPDMVEARLLSARILRLNKELRGAFETIDALPADGPFGVEVVLEKARILQDMEKTAEALALLEDATVRFPHSRRARVELGEALRQAERYEEAVAAYSAAIDMSPGGSRRQDWYLYFLRGVGYERLGRWNEAEADLRKALSLNPAEPNVLNYLGYSYLEQGRNIEEARQLIAKAVELRPGDGFIIDSLGWAYFMAGQYDEAVKHLELAVAAEPGDATINEHLGDAYWRVGRTIEARFRWRAAMDSEPAEDQSRRLVAKLELGLDAAAALAPSGPRKP